MGTSCAKPPKKPTTNLNKGVGDYRANCPTAAPSFKIAGKKLCQVHHLVCVQSINNRKEDSYPAAAAAKKYVEACLQLCGWDINGVVNLLGMPTNRQHSIAAGKNPADLPSHQVDHNNSDGYRLIDVKEYLTNNVWNTVTTKTGKPHDQDVETIKDALENASKEMQRRLVARGKRGDPKKKYMGTEANWEKRSELDCKPTWFFPFSMAADPSPRQPPAAKKPLSNIFKKL
jgi:hypothetical protein